MSVSDRSYGLTMFKGQTAMTHRDDRNFGPFNEPITAVFVYDDARSGATKFTKIINKHIEGLDVAHTLDALSLALLVYVVNPIWQSPAKLDATTFVLREYVHKTFFPDSYAEQEGLDEDE